MCLNFFFCGVKQRILTEKSRLYGIMYHYGKVGFYDFYLYLNLRLFGIGIFQSVIQKIGQKPKKVAGLYRQFGGKGAGYSLADSLGIRKIYLCHSKNRRSGLCLCDPDLLIRLNDKVNETGLIAKVNAIRNRGWK